MGRKIDLSLSHRTTQYVVAGTVVAWVSLLGAGLSTRIGVQPVVAVPAAFGLWIVLTAAWVRRSAGEDEGSTWNAIPQSQYLGQLAGSGGIAKKEQEDALGQTNDDE